LVLKKINFFFCSRGSLGILSADKTILPLNKKNMHETKIDGIVAFKGLEGIYTRQIMNVAHIYHMEAASYSTVENIFCNQTLIKATVTFDPISFQFLQS
jgi:hypothetical protein